MRVLFLASEADPFIKVGGLGDVAGSLPLALRSLRTDAASQGKVEHESPEVDIRLVIPYHNAIRQSALQTRPVAAYTVPHQDGPIPAEIFSTQINGMPVYLISGPPIQESAAVYTGNNDLDGYKYYFFSLAALELPRALGWQPDILHANDWHTAPAIYALNLRRPKDDFYAKIASLLTVHNLPYLGVGAGQQLSAFGLPPAHDSALPWWAQDLPLPLGLLSADHIVAVSPTYAQEILTPEFGSGLYDFLRERQGSISGILNGIDIHRWDPSADQTLAARFSLQQLGKRSENKLALQEEFGLQLNPHIPVLGMITRMDNQKGVDLAIEALRQIGAETWQAILLGTGIHELEDAARNLEADLADKVRAVIRFDTNLSRRIYAGADVLLIPSRYEPCGLAQMIAMRYGCIPVARATGGLRDTIIDADQPRKSNGFLFSEAVPTALTSALRRALSTFGDLRRWRKLQRNSMKQDFSWEHSAREYRSLYRSLIQQRGSK